MLQDVPFLTGRVTDNAQILSPETRSSLSDSLKMHEIRTTNQVVILTIPSLGGESIEDYRTESLMSGSLVRKTKIMVS